MAKKTKSKKTDLNYEFKVCDGTTLPSKWLMLKDHTFRIDDIKSVHYYDEVVKKRGWGKPQEIILITTDDTPYFFENWTKEDYANIVQQLNETR